MNIRKNFSMLRFEEIVFVLNKGINSGYGQITKNLAYDTISFWLNEYLENDRVDAMEQFQIEKKANLSSTKNVTASNGEMYLNSLYTAPIKKEKKILSADEKRAEFLKVFIGELTDEEIQKTKIELGNVNPISLAIVETEIEKRNA